MAAKATIPTELGTEKIGKLLKQYALPAIIAAAPHPITTGIHGMTIKFNKIE